MAVAREWRSAPPAAPHRPATFDGYLISGQKRATLQNAWWRCIVAGHSITRRLRPAGSRASPVIGPVPGKPPSATTGGGFAMPAVAPRATAATRTLCEPMPGRVAQAGVRGPP